MKRGPDPGVKCKLRRGALETDTVEGKIVCLGDLFIPNRGGLVDSSTWIFESSTKLSHLAE